MIYPLFPHSELVVIGDKVTQTLRMQETCTSPPRRQTGNSTSTNVISTKLLNQSLLGSEFNSD